MYKEIKNITSKLHRTSRSIAFIKKAFHNEVTPKFAEVKDNFINTNDRFKSKKISLLSRLNNHVRSHKLLILKNHYLLIKLNEMWNAINSCNITLYIDNTPKRKKGFLYN